MGEGAQARFNVYSAGVGDLFPIAVAKGSTAVINVPAEAGLIVLPSLIVGGILIYLYTMRQAK